MESTQVENLPPPPGIIASLKAGFDVIASHVSAILLPLLLNLFFWLGPRLRADEFFNSIKDFILSSGLKAEEVQRLTEQFDAVSYINFFWILRTFPVGISGLQFAGNTLKTPLGEPVVLQASALSLFGWMLLLTLIGWVGGGFYFRIVAWIATGSGDDQPLHLSRALLQTVMLSAVWFILTLIVGMPLLAILSLILQFNQFLANIIVLVLSLVSMWVIVPLFFWPHGIFIRKQNFLTAIVSSVQMTRFTLPTSSMFILTVFLLSVGLNYLWRIPPESSWITLFGIFGHAFVTTGLLAASFIYYRDMNAWLQKVFQKLRPNAVKQA
jgi:hypothetical protein